MPATDDELRELLSKATPGPWRFYHRSIGTDCDAISGPDERVGLGWDWDDERGNVPPEPMRGVFSKAADAALVEVARNELPRLLDELASLRERLRCAEEALEPFAACASRIRADDPCNDRPALARVADYRRASEIYGRQ